MDRKPLVSFTQLGIILPASGRFFLASSVAIGSIPMHFNWLTMVEG